MKLENESLSETHESCRILSIPNLHKFELTKFVHLIQMGKVPDTFAGAVNTIAHSHNTRSATSGNLALPHPRTDKGKVTIEYKGAQAWNSLPTPLKQMTNTKKFVYELKKIFLQNDINEIAESNS